MIKHVEDGQPINVALQIKWQYGMLQKIKITLSEKQIPGTKCLDGDYSKRDQFKIIGSKLKY